MQFLLPWMEPALERWTRRPIHPLAPKERVPNPNHDRTLVTLAVESPGPPESGGAFQRLSDSVLSYSVFGPKIGTPITKGGRVSVGDTIGLKYRFVPGLDLFFASRVVEVFDTEETETGWRSGFVYRTLEKHPELGEEIFEVTKDKSGAVTFRLEAWSRPNLWYVKLFAPWARWIQKYAARCAVAYLTQVVSEP